MTREKASERYLRQATRGLWGRKRREVREELAAHLEARITAYQIGGLNDTDATERALTELGAPQFVSRGMVQLYTLPRVIGPGLVLMLLCLAVVAFWPKGTAQTMTGTFYYPTRDCLTLLEQGKDGWRSGECVTVNDDFWIDIDDLKSLLAPQGVTFESSGFAAEVLKVSVPRSTPFFIEPYPEESVSGIGSLTRGYVSFWNVVERFAFNGGARLKISGWDNPRIVFNSTSFNLTNSSGVVKGKAFYQSYLNAVLDQGLTVNKRWGKYKDSFGLLHHRVTQLSKGGEKDFRSIHLAVDGVAGEVYGVATLIDPGSTLARGLKKDFDVAFGNFAFYHLNMARLNQDGVVSVRVPNGTFRLVDDVSFPHVKPGDSILVRLAGGNPQTGGWYEVVSPERVSFEPR